MSRVVISNAKAPAEVKVGSESKWMCMCGLSKNKPLCDGSHKQANDEEEGKLYRYVDGKRVEVEIKEVSS
jgi:CDGSH-type Zn-finger protein